MLDRFDGGDDIGTTVFDLRAAGVEVALDHVQFLRQFRIADGVDAPVMIEPPSQMSPQRPGAAAEVDQSAARFVPRGNLRGDPQQDRIGTGAV